ncbi:MAG: hypothetical protein J4452_00705 [Candidatus Aenigmarchaeota archaeon]|nr:hypothetical protein [Candidatus Aenigmarchaeota archaeon]
MRRDVIVLFLFFLLLIVVVVGYYFLKFDVNSLFPSHDKTLRNNSTNS